MNAAATEISPADQAPRFVPTTAHAPSPRTVTVAVVGICGPAHLARCLSALADQQDAPAFDVVVAADSRLTGMSAAASRHAGVRVLATPGHEDPVQLAADALRASTGDLVLLTEDHCVPPPRWVRTMMDAARAEPGAAVIGGEVDTDLDASALDWAFYFVDFFRYAPPAATGASASLSLCNIAYRRTHLDALTDVWTAGYHETALNEAHRSRGLGTLRMLPGAAIRMRRRVAFGDAVRERYAFGRLFGCTRLAHAGPGARAAYVVLSPALPLLMLGRMARKALPVRALRGRFMTALPMLVALVLAWGWGEWLGYLTGRLPSDMTVAPERTGGA